MRTESNPGREDVAKPVVMTAGIHASQAALSEIAVRSVLRKALIKLLKRRPVAGLELLLDLVHIELCAPGAENRFERGSVDPEFNRRGADVLHELVQSGVVLVSGTPELPRYELVQVSMADHGRCAGPVGGASVSNLPKPPIGRGKSPVKATLISNALVPKWGTAHSWVAAGGCGLLIAGCVSSGQLIDKSQKPEFAYRRNLGGESGDGTSGNVQMALPRYSYFISSQSAVQRQGVLPHVRMTEGIDETNVLGQIAENGDPLDRAVSGDRKVAKAPVPGEAVKAILARSGAFQPSLAGSSGVAVQPQVPEVDQANASGTPALKIDTQFASAKRIVPFSYSSATFDQASTKLVDELLPLARIAQRVRVRGNTDAQGLVQANRVLATNRALAVTRKFVAGGVSAAKITTTYCTTCFVASNDTEEGRAANRRVDVEMVLPASTVAGLSPAFDKHAGGNGTIPDPERRTVR